MAKSKGGAIESKLRDYALGFENPNPDVERSDTVRISGGTARALQ